MGLDAIPTRFRFGHLARPCRRARSRLAEGVEMIKRGDYVVCKNSPNGPAGLVRRVAKDGTWMDVWFRGRYGGSFDSWSKRMKTKELREAGEGKG